MSKSVLGSTSEVVTATCAAMCSTASCVRTCSARAAAFLTSSLMNVTRLGYRVMTHFRFRSVPGRLRLSRSVTDQPYLMRWIAALTPRKPAPPVIRTRRSGDPVTRSSLSVTYRAFGSMAPHTLARGYPPEEGYRDYPGRSGEDERLAAGVVAARVKVGSGDEEGREHATDDVQDPFACGAARDQRRDPEDALHRDDPGHDQVSRAKASAQAVVAEVVVGAPQAEQDGEHHEDPSAEAVQERKGLQQSGSQPRDLLAEVVDREAESLFEQDAGTPA